MNSQQSSCLYCPSVGITDIHHDMLPLAVPMNMRFLRRVTLGPDFTTRDQKINDTIEEIIIAVFFGSPPKLLTESYRGTISSS